MKFMIPLLMAALPAASVAQSQPGAGSGVPSVAIPKTTAVLVILTPKEGVTPQQTMSVIPEEIRATLKLYLDGKIRQWYSRAALMRHSLTALAFRFGQLGAWNQARHCRIAEQDYEEKNPTNWRTILTCKDIVQVRANFFRDADHTWHRYPSAIHGNSERSTRVAPVFVRRLTC